MSAKMRKKRTIGRRNSGVEIEMLRKKFLQKSRMILCGLCVLCCFACGNGGTEESQNPTGGTTGGGDDTPLITPAAPPPSQVYFSIHSQQAVRPISPFIYGINGHDFTGRPSNLTLTRSGGNRMTAYNWETNASNAGADWYHQNDAYLGGGETPGGSVTPAIDAAIANQAGSIVTVPMIGYVAADKNGDGDVNQTANYLQERFHPSYPRKTSPLQTQPNTTDSAVYQDEWIYFLQQRYPGRLGSSIAPIFFSLDNEPDLWASTHPRLRGDANGSQGEGVGYAELIELTIDYADAIKEVEPLSIVFGPVNYGWQGMVNLQDAADAGTPDEPGDLDFIGTYLEAMAAAERNHDLRLIDALDIHWYPEAGAYDGNGQWTRITSDSEDSSVVSARLQAPRSLWDATYTEQSWITQHSTQGQPIELLPRLRAAIDAFYPGTQIAITEYYYGGGDHISGALAQADVLGIFGREGVFAATLWRIGSSSHSFIYGGFEMYRDLNGNHTGFGDTSIRALNSDPVDTSVFASVDANNDERLVIVCINKTDAAITAGISVTHIIAFSNAEVFVLTDAAPSPQSAGRNNILLTNAFQYAMPPFSVSTLVLTP